MTELHRANPSLFKKHSSLPSCPPPVKRYLDPDDPLSYERGYNHFLYFQSPAVGAGVLAIAFFLFIIFSSNAILHSFKISTLGITLSFSVFFFLSLAVLMLFIL